MQTNGFQHTASGGWRIDKDPASRKTYSVDWSAWLTPGDTIAGVEFTVADGLTRVAQDHTETVATVRLEGGTDGKTYAVVCLITTAAGDVEPARFEVRVRGA